jgi:hypothetical protein
VLSGGSGIDTVEYGAGFGCSAAVTVTLDNQANDGTSGQHDNVKSDVENVIGGPDEDELFGSTSGFQSLVGGAADDLLVGEPASSDCSGGSACEDRLKGGTGTTGWRDAPGMTPSTESWAWTSCSAATGTTPSSPAMGSRTLW